MYAATDRFIGIVIGSRGKVAENRIFIAGGDGIRPTAPEPIHHVNIADDIHVFYINCSPFQSYAEIRPKIRQERGANGNTRNTHAAAVNIVWMSVVKRNPDFSGSELEGGSKLPVQLVKSRCASHIKIELDARHGHSLQEQKCVVVIEGELVNSRPVNQVQIKINLEIDGRRKFERTSHRSA